MAAARDRYESPYEDGAGFGKFRKRPFRRTTQTTPYDRPPTSARNAGRASGGGNNSWLSKLVDPAQRFIASGAHRLFASVFRKRLPPPPPPQPLEPAISQRDMDEQQEAVLTGPPGAQGAAANGRDTAFNISDRHGVTELELMLKQKTFTRSEIDRLTALLQSRSVDHNVGEEEKKSETMTSKAELSQDKKEDLPIVPVVDNGIGRHLVSAPIVASKVVDEDVATPAELAKAYMDGRPSKLSPSTVASRGQSWREGASSLTNKPLPSDLPIMSSVSRPSGRAGFPANGFVAPRSRGRSAIYSMARTPYSRVQPATTLQGPGTATDVLAGPSSSSQSMWENSNHPGSKQGALKRRISVLENDIGSVGPIRRIRQKSGIFYSSGSIRGTGIGSDSLQHPVTTLKPALMGLPSVEKDNSSIHQSGLRPLPSKSSEMASKILQQLDALVSSREKSPTKLSPSMLRGPALRSLDRIDSSKFLENVQANKLDAEQEIQLPDVQDSMSQKEELKENGPLKYDIIDNKSASAVDTVDLTRSGVTDAITVISSAVKSVGQPHQNKQSFQMTAHEDYVELDDGDDDVTTSATLAEGRQKLDATVAGNKTTAPEISVLENPLAPSEGNLSASSILNQKSAGNADGYMVAEKNAGFTFQATAFPSMTMQQTVVHSPSAVVSEAAPPDKSHFAPPIFTFGEKVLPKEQNGSVNTLENNIKTTEEVPQCVFASSSAVVSDLSGPKPNPSENARPESSSRVAPEFGTKGLSDLDKAEKGNGLKTSVNSRAAEIVLSSLPSSSPSVFSFGTPAKSSTLHNGPLASTPSVFSSAPSQISSSSPLIAVDKIGSGAIAVTTTSEMATSSSSLTVSASAPTFTAAPIFKFGSTAVSSITSSSVSATVEKKSAEANTKETSVGSLNGSLFGGKSSAIISSEIGIFGGASSGTMSTGSNTFGDVSPVITTTGTSLFGATHSAVTTTTSSTFSFSGGATASTAASQSLGAHPFSNGSATSAQASAAGTGSSSQSMPLQFGLSGSSPSFGLTGNTTLSSGSSIFNSSTAPTLFNSGAAFGVTSSSSPSDVNTSSSSTTSTMFGSSWPTSQSPIFGSTFNSSTSSTSFTFGASASDAGTRSTSAVYGSSSSAPSGSLFSFSSPAAAAQTQPVFGNPTPAFAFGSSPSINNDQMSMEDSMAEDTVQATTPMASLFGQQPAAPLSSSFVFGSTAPTGVNQFASSVPSAANPFQFGGQANLATPQNTSPFQASGSLELNAAGSFSLGTGGGEKSNRKFVKVRRTAQRKR